MSKQWMRCSREIRLLTDELCPDEERTADSSVVTSGSDSPDDFPASLDEPNEGITEQWHSTSGTSLETSSVQSNPPESSVSVSQTPFRLRQHRHPDIDAT